MSKFMLDHLQKLFGHQYIPLNRIEISKTSLIHNYKYLSSLSLGTMVAPVLKSNAYGHGIIEIAKIIDPLKPPFVCVDSLFEAYELLKAGIKSKILIMGFVSPKNLAVKSLPFSFAVFSISMLEAIKKYQPHAGVHIFVDTGMSREGILINELSKFVDICIENKLNIEGLMSHLAMAGEPDSTVSKLQLKNFQIAQDMLAQKNIQPKYVHLMASAGLLHHESYPAHGNLARSGIAIYGIDPDAINANLKPVLALKSTIVQIKEISAGASVGYDSTFIANQNMKIAIIPIGYHDGVDRRLSNLGSVSVGGKDCPIIGKVSMNLTTIDVSKIKKIEVGDEVEIFGSDVHKFNSIQSQAKAAGMIPYELLVHLDSSIHRNVIYFST